MDGLKREFESAQKKYDREYFEDGIIVGKSCYQNYRWMPETTIKMAFYVIKHLDMNEGDRVLDFGCAKGYLVKALRILDIDAYGCDISQYAIDKVDSDVKEYCRLVTPESMIPFEETFDWIFTKDVLEHLKEGYIDSFLDTSKRICDKMFHVIPLGENGKYRVPNYHLDRSHIIIQPESWWQAKFEQHGWRVTRFDFKVRGIKESWTHKYERGNGFFIVEHE